MEGMENKTVELLSLYYNQSPIWSTRTTCCRHAPFLFSSVKTYREISLVSLSLFTLSVKSLFLRLWRNAKERLNVVGEEIRYFPAQFIDPEIGKFYPLRFCTDLCTFVVGSVSVSVPLFPTHLFSAASYIEIEFIATNVRRHETGPRPPRYKSTQGS
jgi:hypothetical protein